MRRPTGLCLAAPCLAALCLALASFACTRSEVRQKETNPTKPFYRAAGTGPAFWGPGDTYTFLATGDETGHAYFQMEALVPSGGGPPPHIHHGEDETFYLAQGNLEIRVGNEFVSAKAGDFVNIPKGTLHGFRNVGDKPATMLVTYVPAGFESFFEEVFPPAKDRRAAAPQMTEEMRQKMMAAAAKHGLEIPPMNPD